MHFEVIQYKYSNEKFVICIINTNTQSFTANLQGHPPLKSGGDPIPLEILWPDQEIGPEIGPAPIFMKESNFSLFYRIHWNISLTAPALRN